jgi:CRISPR-associated exonuclease Cas4
MNGLSDERERVRALTDLGATLLVEAAAGTGKTSLLAGRVVVLLASGVSPREIAAITFTEFAAGELRERVTRFLAELLAGTVPEELRLAFAEGVTPAQCAALEPARDRLDELTCSTIHRFCHDLLRIYAVEAGIDPGADILDEVQGDLALRRFSNVGCESGSTTWRPRTIRLLTWPRTTPSGQKSSFARSRSFAASIVRRSPCRATSIGAPISGSPTVSRNFAAG